MILILIRTAMEVVKIARIMILAACVVVVVRMYILAAICKIEESKPPLAVIESGTSLIMLFLTLSKIKSLKFRPLRIEDILTRTSKFLKNH